MASNSTATQSMAFQAHVSRMFRALGGWGAAPAAPVEAQADDFDDDDVEEPAIAGEDMTTARDRSCLANYPLGVTG